MFTPNLERGSTVVAIQPMERRRTLSRKAAMLASAPLFWQVLALVVLSIGGRLWLGAHSNPGNTIRAAGMLAPLFVVVLQGATVMTPMGTSMIPTLNGMLFPLLLAVLLNLIGGLAGGIAMYYVWRRGDRDLHIQQRLQALPPWARRFARNDLLSLIIMRMLPWAGGNLSTFVAGAYRVPLRVHVASVIIGSLPGSIIYALLGAGIIAL
jgi:uncharacterized membrane protein YdjX (TVP38/TMEM64 family)